MTILNYSPRLDFNDLADVRFTIGTDEFATTGAGRELVSLTIQRPRLEPGIPNSPYGWTGNFTLQHTLEARKNGRDSNFYDEYANPNRWRKAQQKVEVRYKGYKIATLRITDQYAFTQYENGGTATGGLFDLLGLLNRDIPPITTEGVEIGAGTPIKTCIEKLLLEAGKKRYANGTTVQLFDSQFPYPVITCGCNGDVLDTNLVTSNPLQSAQELLGKYFYWLYVDKDEVIRDIGYLEGGFSTISRSEKQCEITKDPNAIHFAGSRVTVSGSRRVKVPAKVDPTAPEPEPNPMDPATTDSGKPLKIITTRRVLRGTLAPTHFLGDTNYIELTKTIYYTYGSISKTTGLPVTGIDLTGDFEEALISTVTETEKNFLEVYPNKDSSLTISQTNNALLLNAIALRETESLTEKSTEITYFEFAPETRYDDETNFNINYFNFEKLVKVEDETVQNFKIGGSNSLIPRIPKLDPKTGQALALEKQPTPELPQKAPEFNFETQTLKGIVTLPPIAYSLFYEDGVYYNAGFLPSQLTASNLAGAIALKELYARDSYNVTFPDFDEWLGSGARPFMRCAVDTHYLIATNDIFLFGEDGTTSLTIYGNRQSGITKIPNPRALPVYPTTGLRIAPFPSLVLIIGEAIIPIQATAIGGTAPYTFSSVDLPAGLSISSSGLITGTPTLTQSSTASTITVTDNLSNTANGQIYITVIALTVIPQFTELIDIAVSAGATCSLFMSSPDANIQINVGARVSITIT